MAVVACCRGIYSLTTGLVVKPNYKWEHYTVGLKKKNGTRQKKIDTFFWFF
jgi:hypothetical protein